MPTSGGTRFVPDNSVKHVSSLVPLCPRTALASRATAEKHDEQVREAVRQDRDDLARRALDKKHAVTDQLVDLDDRIDRLQATQDRLVERQVVLRGRIEGFRTRKETLKARHEAARAEVRVAEAFAGVGGEMADVGRAIERATERTERMEARAAALEELEETGALDDILAEGDEIDLGDDDAVGGSVTYRDGTLLVGADDGVYAVVAHDGGSNGLRRRGRRPRGCPQ